MRNGKVNYTLWFAFVLVVFVYLSSMGLVPFIAASSSFWQGWCLAFVVVSSFDLATSYLTYWVDKRRTRKISNVKTEGEVL